MTSSGTFSADSPRSESWPHRPFLGWLDPHPLHQLYRPLRLLFPRSVAFYPWIQVTRKERSRPPSSATSLRQALLFLLGSHRGSLRSWCQNRERGREREFDVFGQTDDCRRRRSSKRELENRDACLQSLPDRMRRHPRNFTRRETCVRQRPPNSAGRPRCDSTADCVSSSMHGSRGVFAASIEPVKWRSVRGRVPSV